jgi:tryptophan synthase alpha chain
MTRYAAMFERCRHRALGAFLMLGDPGIGECETYLDALVEGGADMVELGIPFSDPVADGPVIQAAAVRALEAGVRTGDCLSMVARFRDRHPDVPVGILTYANIAAARGIGRFAAELAEAGADSLLVADVPSLEAAPYAAAARVAGIDLVMIAAPNTPKAAIEHIARLSSGYTYCVARAGVTGADQRLRLDHAQLFAMLAEAGAAPPVLGFGIASAEQVKQALAAGAAGVISGSAIVDRIGRGATPGQVAAFVGELKAATASERLDFAGAAF